MTPPLSCPPQPVSLPFTPPLSHALAHADVHYRLCPLQDCSLLESPPRPSLISSPPVRPSVRPPPILSPPAGPLKSPPNPVHRRRRAAAAGRADRVCMHRPSGATLAMVRVLGRRGAHWTKMLQCYAVSRKGLTPPDVGQMSHRLYVHLRAPLWLKGRLYFAAHLPGHVTPLDHLPACPPSRNGPPVGP